MLMSRVACGRAVMLCLALRSSASGASIDCSRLPVCIVPLGQLSMVQAGTRLPVGNGQGLFRACARWHLLLAPSSKELDLGMVCHLEAQAQAALLCASIPLGRFLW